MSGLVARLAEAAYRRGLLDARSAVPTARAFALVRDMPYRRASSRRPEAIIDEWRGTCSGKHYVLHGIFEELGLDSRLCLATHVFDEAGTRHFPPALRAEGVAAAVPDVHTFLRIRAPAGWTDVDATWPRAAGRLGLPVNEQFIPGQSMTLACAPIDISEIPAGVDPQAVKEALGAWLAEA
jgi:hypothetical protein